MGKSISKIPIIYFLDIEIINTVIRYASKKISEGKEIKNNQMDILTEWNKIYRSTKIVNVLNKINKIFLLSFE